MLPSKFPNLLVNGSKGVAVGMATEIPPHNLREVSEAVTRVIDNPDVSVEELMAVIATLQIPGGQLFFNPAGSVLIRRM